MTERLLTLWYACRLCGHPATPAPRINRPGMTTVCTRCGNRDHDPLVVSGNSSEIRPGPTAVASEALLGVSPL